jgi:histidyl-tRNA synthetase
MLRINDIKFPNTALFMEEAINIAEYYGFKEVDEALSSHKTTAVNAKRIDSRKISFARRDEKNLLEIVHTCADRGLGSGSKPLFLWKEGSIIRSGGSQYATLELHTIGVVAAIAEALLLSVTDAIATESGIERRVVCLNSIGTTESSARYTRDLTEYLRKNISDISPNMRFRVSKDPLGVLSLLVDKEDALAERAPVSMEYLNEDERRHFWDLLEYLEVANLYYELNPRILGSRDCWAHSLFDVCKIDSENENLVPFARGGRYDTLASTCLGVGATAVGITIMCELHGRSEVKRVKRKESNKIFFAHLGPEAKRKSIPVLELLRLSNIGVHQSLAYDHIGEQMRIAKRLKVPYILIMGHKEATEGTILVRDTLTNSQEPIVIDLLPGYLKRRRLSKI